MTAPARCRIERLSSNKTAPSKTFSMSAGGLASNTRNRWQIWRPGASPNPGSVPIVAAGESGTTAGTTERRAASPVTTRPACPTSWPSGASDALHAGGPSPGGRRSWRSATGLRPSRTNWPWVSTRLRPRCWRPALATTGGSPDPERCMRYAGGSASRPIPWSSGSNDT